MIRRYIILIAILLSVSALKGQTIALRSNALLWCAEAANLSVDFTTSSCSSVGVTGVVSMADSWIKNTNLKGCQFEYRYWFARQPYHSLFVGPVAGVFHYRVKDDAETQLCVPAGLQMGYSWTLDKHWNIEANYGVGYLYYVRASRDSEGILTKENHHKFTAINLGLSFSYLFF